MNDVFIAHPGLQHSHQLALALYENELLMEFCSGTPVICRGEVTPWYIPNKYAARVKRVEIERARRSHPILFQLLLKMHILLPRKYSKNDYQHRIFHLFDKWISFRLEKLKPRVVIAYENSAYETFLKAKKLGIICVLDAPSFHHKSGEKLLKVVETPYLKEINRRKDVEVDLADYILCCSPLAAETYIEEGVSVDKVFPMLLGANLPDFKVEFNIHDEPIHFIFAGVLSERKSIDIICAVFMRLFSEGVQYKLSFIGGCENDKWLHLIKSIPNSSYTDSVSQVELYTKFSNADCLLLPSRFDSFGMVVAEAMACGIPAIVSTQVGAKAIIERFTDAGWIVDVTENSLYKCIKNIVINRDELFKSKIEAKKAADIFTWDSYKKRIVNFMVSI